VSTRAEVRAEVLALLYRRNVPLTTSEIARALERHLMDVYPACRVLWELGELERFRLGGNTSVLWALPERAHA